MHVRACIQVVLVLASIGTAVAEPYRVVGVKDGDTLVALNADRSRITCRLHGIDAPERKQAFGQAAKTALSQLTFGRGVDIELTGTDRYRRSLCKVSIDGLDVNRHMVATGMAWMYRRYTSDPAYAAAELAARSQRLGVWSDPEPVPPWAYRKRKH